VVADASRRLVILVVAIVVLAGVAAGVVLRRGVLRPIAYYPVSAQSLGVVVVDAPGIACDVARVTETDASVQIAAECQEPLLPVPEAGAAKLNVFTVNIGAPLGSRQVVDGSGNEAELCRQGATGCMPASP